MLFQCELVVLWLERWVSDQENFVGSNPTWGDISENHSKSSKDIENNSQSSESQKNVELN